MHSSRMRTVRCSGRLMGGGVFAQGVCVCPLGDVCPGGVCPGGGECLPRRWRVSAQEGVCLEGLPKWGWCMSVCPGGVHLPPPVDRVLDTRL